MLTIKPKHFRIMKEIHLKTRDWERLLTYEQQQKYKYAIKQGWFSDYHGSSWRHDTFYGAYIWKHPKYINVVRTFSDLVGHKPLWSDVTDDNLRDLTEKIQELYAPNSSRTICATIKAVIRENDEKGIRSSKFDSILRVKRVPVQAVYLDDNEIQSLIDYIPHGSVERYVKRMFILECLCGARLSDCHNITPENIDDTGKYIVYVAQKTKAEVRVPLHKKLRPFLYVEQLTSLLAELLTFTSTRFCERYAATAESILVSRYSNAVSTSLDLNSSSCLLTRVDARLLLIYQRMAYLSSRLQS